jgi:hypothetical protein
VKIHWHCCSACAKGVIAVAMTSAYPKKHPEAAMSSEPRDGLL